MKKLFLSTNYWVKHINDTGYFETKVTSGLRQNFPNIRLTTSGYSNQSLENKNIYPVDGECVILTKSVVKNFLKLFREIRQSDVIIIKMFQLTNVFVFLLCILMQKKFIMMLVGDAPKSLQLRSDLIPSRYVRNVLSNILRLLLKQMVLKSLYTIFVSNDLKFKFSGRNTDIVASESWLDENWLDPTPKTVTIDILYVGRLVIEKGLGELMEAVAREPLLRKLRVVIVGEGKDRSLLETLAKRHNLNIEFKGRVQSNSEELRDLYIKSNIFVLPSYSEGTPLCIMEAAAAQCIIVSTSVGGIPELLGENYPFFVEIKSVQTLQNALVRAHTLSDFDKDKLLQNLSTVASERTHIKEQKRMWEPLKEFLNE